MRKMLFATSAMIAPTAFATGAARVAPDMTGVAALNITVPKRETNRGSVSAYQSQFDALEIGQAFGVKNKTAKQLSSIVSNANKKARIDKTDENGNPVFKTTEATDAAGNKMTVPTGEREQVATKRFVVIDVTDEIRAELDKIKGKPFDGATALIKREEVA